MNTMPDAAKARRIDTAEAAKMLRPQLKKAFPGVKFGVRISRYAGGSSIHVGWTDGPTDDQVTALCAGFAGKRFDGMDDLQYGADSWYCAEHGARPAATWGTGDDRSKPIESRCCARAELVHFGSGYVSTARALSPEFRAELRALVLEDCGLPADTSEDAYLPECSTYHYGGAYDQVRDAVFRISRTR